MSERTIGDSWWLAAAAAALLSCSRVSSPPPEAEPAQAPSPPPPAPSPAPSAAASAPTAAAATPPPTESDDCAALDDGRPKASCEAKREFRAFVAEHQSCGAASDCAIVSGACPFGCYIPAAKSSAEQVKAKLSELGERLEKAGARCVYRCMSPPAPACVAGRCSTAQP